MVRVSKASTARALSQRKLTSFEVIQSTDTGTLQFSCASRRGIKTLWRVLDSLRQKKRALGNGKFEAFTLTQAKRIHRRAPRAQYVLYDAADITGFGDNVVPIWPLVPPLNLPLPQVSKTHAICTPLATVIATGACTPSLYKYGVPLSWQLVMRYFRGFDLHFRERDLNTVRGFAAKLGGAVQYVLAVGIAIGESVEPQLPQLNGDAYQPLDGGAP